MIDPINHAITIDLAKTNSIIPFYQLGQNDTASHKFVFSIFNNSLAYDLTSLTAKVYFTKEDTNGCFLICTIDDAVNGKMSCLLTTQCLTCPGIVQGEITIYGTAGEILTSITFKFLVKKIVRNDSAIESTSEFTALTTALAQVTDFANVKNELIAAREGEVDLPTKMSKLDSALANKAKQTDLNIEKARIDSFVAMPPTVDNVETTDIRVGADGIVYNSAGDAMRTQFNDIYSSLGTMHKRLFLNFKRGGIDGTGQDIESSTTLRTDWQYFNDISFISAEKEYQIIIYKKDSVGNIVYFYGSSISTEITAYCPIIDKTCSYKMLIKYKDNTLVTETDLEKLFVLQFNSVPTSKLNAINLEENVPLRVLDGGILNVTTPSYSSTQLGQLTVPYWLRFPNGVISFKNVNLYSIIIYTLNENGEQIDRNVIATTTGTFAVETNKYYWISLYSPGLELNNYVEVKCKYSNHEIFVDEEIENIKNNFSSMEGTMVEIPLIFENGTMNSDGTNAISDLIIRSQLVPTEANKIYLLTFPINYCSTINVEQNGVRNNIGRMYSSYSVTNYVGFIRFTLYKTDGTVFTIADLTIDDIANIHLYEIPLTTNSEHDIYVSSPKSVKKGNVAVNGVNDQSIIQGLFNCLDSLKVYFYGGEYHFSEIYVTNKSKQHALLYTNEITSNYHTIEIDGDYTGRTADLKSVKFFVDIDGTEIGVGEYAFILIPRRTIELDGETLSNTLFKIDSICILGFGYTKPFVYLDCTHAQASMISNVIVRGDGSITGLKTFDTKPNENCVGIRAGHGSNNGLQNYIKHCLALYCGKGYSICGEHYILEDNLAHHCYDGFAFGDRLTRGNYEHPNIMIGCSIEGCYRLMQLSKYGATVESTVTMPRNTLVCIGLSAETSWGIPLDELIEGGETFNITKPIYEVIKGNYRGRIEGDYRGSSVSIFDVGSGTNMTSITY